ncbi:outer membrane protein transport protein [Acinetobacter baumannii]|uniref:OmpP1/FadL family transporter n=1 Tax=Acinetobacter calcoaceticus/baumannii complex TaxID=909768 RepID=UPI000DE74CB6|nr:MULTISPECIES: outer membrane protein transport protein [Acinetobacter calcoaceticus/baumannii complex]MDE9410332.1 outer membrane protein transport protein [Acinetobacter nosocomialis]MDH2511775.1 outer membrane protein transport protein [Acinetobacter baumannii]MDH2549335.1 outer membrane protein transport protein [Acinetobacter baumannii]MDH2643029.1 outer membrane protein transport protein [Acinetobacter baumannii]MDH2648649.1 outer membrane protein transport protein [Acinetobacter bauma
MEKSLSMDYAELKLHLEIVKDTIANNPIKYFFDRKHQLKSGPIIFSAVSVFFSAYSQASALEQSGQSILPFLEAGNYAEANAYAIDPSVSGVVHDRPDLGRPNQSRDTGDIGQNNQFYTAALKLQLTDQFSFGLLYDQPFAAKTEYPVLPNNSYSDETSREGTSVNVKSQNLSFILGYSPIKNFQVYGGPVYQSVEGDVSFRGMAYTEAFNGYNAKFKEQGKLGWLVGGSYQIPEIALKAAVTYRSKIKYDFQVDENIFGEPLQYTAPAKTKVETPQSVNVDFQTGIAEKTLAYMNLRWVNWKKFNIRPAQYDALTAMYMDALTEGAYKQGIDLDSYQKDQYSVTLGLGQQLTDRWSIASDIGWDSGSGHPASTLGPVNGFWSFGLGAQFNPAPNYFIAAGVKYFWLGDTKAEGGGYFLPIEGIKEFSEQAEFKDNHAIAYALKFGYRF